MLLRFDAGDGVGFVECLNSECPGTDIAPLYRLHTFRHVTRLDRVEDLPISLAVDAEPLLSALVRFQ